MADYGFYTGVYMGSAISEQAFPGLIARAEAQLQRYRRLYLVRESGEDSVRLALCAMAEAIQESDRRRGIHAQNVGGVSVTYRDDVQEGRQVYRAVSMYLDIYRGVSTCTR